MVTPLRVEDYFQYKPSLALNTIALVLFALITLIVAVQTVKHKQRYMWLIVFTGGLEVAGYICHLVAAEKPNLNAYIANLVFIILAPNFLALANYVTVGKVAEQLELTGRYLNTKTLSVGFFLVDILCIGVQGGGCAVLSATLQTKGIPSKTGENVYLIGLAIQLFFFASFAFVTVYVYYLQQTRAANKVPSQAFICLAATIALVTLRNIYRVIEIAVGWTGKYNTHEVYFYTLDSLPIFAAFCVYSLLHFGRYLDAPLALQLPTTATDLVMVKAPSKNTSHAAESAISCTTNSKLQSNPDTVSLAAHA